MFSTTDVLDIGAEEVANRPLRCFRRVGGTDHVAPALDGIVSLQGQRGHFTI